MKLTVYEPDHLSPEIILDAMSLVTRDKPGLPAAQGWTRNEQLLAYDWAIREHLAASDNPTQRRQRPAFTRGPCPCGAAKDANGEGPGSWHGCQWQGDWDSGEAAAELEAGS